MSFKIPFNKPYFTGKETVYIYDAVQTGKISGDGIFTKKCQEFLEQKYGFKKCLLTTSCTDALEMAAILLQIEPGDEVIVPSYTFVSSVNAFALRGAKPVFVDSGALEPNMDADKIEALITPKTKAIVVVHYAGVACDMNKICEVAKKHGVTVVEDAAQAIDSFYEGKPLGTFGALAAFSFHETKNIISGEGGLLVINDESLISRAEVIREKGTNRSAFFRGEVDKYNWVDIGSSFLPSDIIAAFLYAQLEKLDDIQKQRITLWSRYNKNLQALAETGKVRLPYIPSFATNNAHMFYMVTSNLDERERLIAFLKENGIYAVFHYISLHTSNFYTNLYGTNVPLPYSELYTDCLVRLPLFYELTLNEVDFICDKINAFYQTNSPS